MSLYEAKSIFKRAIENPCGVRDDNINVDIPLIHTAADIITRTWDLQDIVITIKTKVCSQNV